jgi:hypothetical protein
MKPLVTNPHSFRQIIPVMIAFCGISAYGIFHHELWLDEAQHFLIARDSSSLGELATNMKYDGHVQLWNYMLFFITHFISIDPMAMQVFHFVVINAAVYVLLRYGRLPLLIKLGVIFSYYFLFEYSLVSRNYAPGILLLFSCCALMEHEQKYLAGIACLCFLMINTHLFFLFAALGIFCWFLIDAIRRRKFTQQFYFFTGMITAGIIIAVFQISMIPSDNTYFHPANISFKYSSVIHPFYSMARGFFPLQSPSGLHFWNTYLFDAIPTFFKYILTLVVVVLPLITLAGNSRALVFYLLSAGLLGLFLFVSQMAGNRYFGIYFIFFIAACWMAGIENPLWLNFRKIKIRRTALAVAIIVFLGQFGAGMYAWSKDITHPFTMAGKTAAYIKDQNKPGPVVMKGYGAGPALSAYLKKQLYYLDIGSEGSYCIWKKSYFNSEKKSIAIAINHSEYLNSQNEFLLVSAGEVQKQELDSLTNFQVNEIARFTGSIVNPDYFLYSVKRLDDVNASRYTGTRQ